MNLHYNIVTKSWLATIKGMEIDTTLTIIILNYFIIYILACNITYTLAFFPFLSMMLSSNNSIHENDKVLKEYHLRDKDNSISLSK